MVILNLFSQKISGIAQFCKGGTKMKKIIQQRMAEEERVWERIDAEGNK